MSFEQAVWVCRLLPPASPQHWYHQHQQQQQQQHQQQQHQQQQQQQPDIYCSLLVLQTLSQSATSWRLSPRQRHHKLPRCYNSKNLFKLVWLHRILLNMGFLMPRPTPTTKWSLTVLHNYHRRCHPPPTPLPIYLLEKLQQHVFLVY